MYRTIRTALFALTISMLTFSHSASFAQKNHTHPPQIETTASGKQMKLVYDDGSVLNLFTQCISERVTLLPPIDVFELAMSLNQRVLRTFNDLPYVPEQIAKSTCQDAQIQKFLDLSGIPKNDQQLIEQIRQNTQPPSS